MTIISVYLGLFSKYLLIVQEENSLLMLFDLFHVDTELVLKIEIRR